MDRIFLGILCAGIVVLVTALALTTPSLRSDGPAEQSILLREGVR
jgi:hypothetical protein